MKRSKLSSFKLALRAGFLGESVSSAPRAAIVRETLSRPDGERAYLLACPREAAAGKRPLVVALHGGGASAEQLLGQAFPPSPLSMWLEIAERERLVLLAPDAGKAGWNDGSASQARAARQDDVAFIDALIDRMIAKHEVDHERVYLIGVSRGGLMAYRIASELPHKLAAFSAVLACMPPSAQAPLPAKALSALIVGGTADPLMPYHGGKYFYTLGLLDPVLSIEDSARIWRELAGLPDTPVSADIAHRNARDKTRATRMLWGADAGAIQVGLYRIEHGGHAEPSITQRYPYFINKLVGAQNADFEMAEAAWEFFKDKRCRCVSRRPESVD